MTSLCLKEFIVRKERDMKTLKLYPYLKKCITIRTLSLLALGLVQSFLFNPFVHAQTFDSTSDGSDGVLNLTTPGTIEFDPVALGLDPDGDHIFHFTTITIGPDVIVKLSAKYINAPVFWLASGAVQIDGTVDLNGEDGQDGDDIVGNAGPTSIPGSGGFGGGVGRTGGIPIGQSGTGPGAGNDQAARGGGGGGHNGNGFNARGASNAGSEYGNIFQNPLLGGSGGAGGSRFDGSRNSGAGGAGGGALLIASSTSIAISGTIQANGGKGGTNASSGGGGGSGGSIRLAAPGISGSGNLTADGGAGGVGASFGCPSNFFDPCDGGFGAKGRIRIESFENLFAGSADPLPSLSSPFAIALPAIPFPSIRVVSVDGVPVSSNPTGSFTIPDATINNGSPVSIVIEAQHIPLGTVAQLHLLTENEGTQISDSSPLEGTPEISTATVTTTVPGGFSRGFVRATWSSTP